MAYLYADVFYLYFILSSNPLFQEFKRCQLYSQTRGRHWLLSKAMMRQLNHIHCHQSLLAFEVQVRVAAAVIIVCGVRLRTCARFPSGHDRISHSSQLSPRAGLVWLFPLIVIFFMFSSLGPN